VRRLPGTSPIGRCATARLRVGAEGCLQKHSVADLVLVKMPGKVAVGKRRSAQKAQHESEPGTILRLPVASHAKPAVAEPVAWVCRLNSKNSVRSARPARRVFQFRFRASSFSRSLACRKLSTSHVPKKPVPPVTNRLCPRTPIPERAGMRQDVIKILVGQWQHEGLTMAVSVLRVGVAGKDSSGAVDVVGSPGRGLFPRVDADLLRSGAMSPQTGADR
jgi:hypothetical protein